ncbi:pyridoxal phosphate-dependent aminotransferase [Aquimarina intermedia]|uniref:Aminotransferase n=1 Tax=Aquimarina intermedia TaxID=350814 RepID=A0A5S5CD03_9FLAO|nr:aminotransferase class I/II-fold pyridoxal phosphate-dependent enzyme [Aquimarina intermedia]TYP75883.1 aspartate/methionine/tyrosine aminotransferase [Aquimarina intermedia]
MKVQTAKRLDNVEEYYFSSKLREVRALASAGKPILNLAIGSPDLEPPVEVVRAMQSAMREKGVHQYQSYQGVPQLRTAIAEFYQNKFGVDLDSESEILPLMGSKEGIMHVSMAYLNAGDQVLIPNPGYPTYASVTKLLDAEPIAYELTEQNNWEPDFQALEQLDLRKVKLMWVNYPHMPTGASGNLLLFERLIHFAKKHNILVINDNPYSFVLNPEPISIFNVVGAKDHALELNSLSKSFNMAGWRVGMVMGGAEKIQAILQVKSNMDSGMFLGIQHGALAALQISDQWYENLNVTYAKRRKLIWKLAKKLNCMVDHKAVGLFVWAKLPAYVNGYDFIEKLLREYNIFVTPGAVFGIQGAGYLRFSLCANIDQIEEALHRIAGVDFSVETLKFKAI